MQVYSTNIQSNNDLRQCPAPPPPGKKVRGGGAGFIKDISNRRLYEGVQQQTPFYHDGINRFHGKLDERRLQRLVRLDWIYLLDDNKPVKLRAPSRLCTVKAN
jgi:hypothetical protein